MEPRTLSKDRRYLIVALVGSALLLAIDIVLPLGWDDQLFQSMALDLLRYHQLPYIGSWAHDFPGIIYIHWVSIVLFGDSHLGFRVFDVLLHLVFSGLLFSLLRRWLSGRTSALVVILYNLRYVAGGIALASQRDTYAMFFLVLATLLLLRSQRPVGRSMVDVLILILAGISFAVVGSIRATYASYPIVAIAYLALSSKSKARDISALIVGLLIVVAAVVVPYVFVKGGLREVYLAVFQYNLDIYGPIHSPIITLLRYLRTQKVYVIGAALGLALIYPPAVRNRFRIRLRHIEQPSRNDQILMYGFSLAALLSLFVMAKYLPCHFEPVFLIAIPFVALALEGLLGALQNRTVRVIALVILIAYFVIKVYPIGLLHSAVTLAASSQGSVIEALQDSSVDEPAFRSSIDRAVANYIDSNSSPSDRFESCSLTSGIRLLTHRQSASRFTTFYPVDMPPPNGIRPQYQLEWRKEYVDSLRSARPLYVAIGDGPKGSLDWVKETPLQAVNTIPGFKDLLDSNYRRDTIIGGFHIFRHKN